MDSMDIGKQLKSMEGYDGPSMADIQNQLKRIEGYNGSTVVLLVEDSAKVAELRRIISDAGNLPHVKVVRPSELDGADGCRPTHIEIDGARFLPDALDAYMLKLMREKPSDDFRRSIMSEAVAGDKIEQEIRAERRGKWKGRQAFERGWRR